MTPIGINFVTFFSISYPTKRTIDVFKDFLSSSAAHAQKGARGDKIFRCTHQWVRRQSVAEAATT